MQILSSPLTLKGLLAYCAAVVRISELAFILLLAALSLALSAAVGYGMTWIGFHEAERPELLSHGVLAFIWIAVIFGPILETLLLQHFPILVARRFDAPIALQFAMGSVPFAAVHFPSGAIAGVAAGIAGGAVFSLAYLTFVPQSRTKAFWATAAVHSLHNLVPVVLYVRELQ